MATGESVVQRARRRARRLTRRGVPIAVVHCAHHKVGTSWFGKVLTSVAEHYGLRYVYVAEPTAPPHADVYLLPHSRLFEACRAGLPPFRGSHMIRDPRDVVVSGYHYHLWTEEKWANKPLARFDGRSYRDHLGTLDLDEGLMVELERTCSGQLRDMLSWDYAQPEFLELRYEELIADEAGIFERVFEHYGFSRAAIERSLAFVEAASFRSVVGRDVGEVAERSHLRSGRPGEWRDHFTPAHVARMKELAGDALVDLGYESDHSWGL